MLQKSLTTTYTSDKVILNILRDDGIHLWASHIKSFEDKEEYIYASALFHDVLAQMKERKNFDKTFLSLLEETKPSKKQMIFNFNTSGSYPLITPEFIIPEWYILCFSKEPSSDFMWKNYAGKDKNYGWNINFFAASLIHIPNLYIGKVLYDQEQQAKEIENAIKAYWDQYNNKSLSIEDIIFNLSDDLATWSIFFKSNKHMDEQEIRVAVGCKNKITLDDVTFEPQTRKDAYGNSISYLDLVFNKKTFEKITPDPHKTEDEKQKLFEILRLRGYRI